MVGKIWVQRCRQDVYASVLRYRICEGNPYGNYGRAPIRPQSVPELIVAMRPPSSCGLLGPHAPQPEVRQKPVTLPQDWAEKRRQPPQRLPKLIINHRK